MKPALAAIALLFFTVSVNAQPKANMTASEYSTYLNGITKSIDAQVTKWGKQFLILRDGSKTFSYLKPFRTDLTDYINKKRIEIKNLAAVPKEGEALKTAVLNYMDYETGMINKSFIPFESFTAKSSEKEVNAALQNVVKAGGTERELKNKVKIAQQTYAKANGFMFK